MTRARKQRARLERRVKEWMGMSTVVGMIGTTTKLVRRHDGKGAQAHHKPGSLKR